MTPKEKREYEKQQYARLKTVGWKIATFRIPTEFHDDYKNFHEAMRAKWKLMHPEQ